MGYLCYLGPLLLIPLLARPKSRFLRYHCNQGLLLLIFAVLIGIAGGIATLVWLVQGFMNVSRGLRRPLSFIGEITLLK